VTTSAPFAFDPLALIGVLNARGVRFVVIGGIAAGVQGAIWTTTDLDICHARTRDDYRRLARALADLNARPVDLPEDAALELDDRALRNGDWWALWTRFGKLDCMGEPAPGVNYEYLAPRSRLIRGRQTYRVASLEDLAIMKEAAGRPKDRAHLEIIRATAAEIEAKR
jgi:hypothetical protein